MKKYAVILLLMPLFAFSATHIVLSPKWSKGKAIHPTLFTAAKFEKGKLVKSINIFEMDSKKSSVQDLKSKVISKKLTNVGEGYLIRSQQNYDSKDCYILNVENIRSKKKFDQIWCFPSDRVVVLQTTNYETLHPKTRQSIVEYFNGL